VEVIRFLGVTALALVVGLSGCGGSTKTVVQTVTASPSASTSSSTSSTITVTTPTGPQPCQDVQRAQNIRPTVCDLPNGTFIKVATENYPLRLKSLTVRFVGAHSATSVSDPSGAASATANGTFEIITLRVTNDSNTPQTVESVGGNAFALETLSTNSKTYTESFQAENQADPNSFVSQNTAPIQPDASQTGDIVFDLPASALAKIRSSGAGLLFGEFGTDLSTASPSNTAGHPFGFVIIHHVKLQG
jgi:Domain of unknown function (DUF4352)